MELETKKKTKTRPKKVKQTVLSTVNPTPSASSLNSDAHMNQIPCRFFQVGQCNKGDECPFLHRKAAHFSPHPCKFFMYGNGFCRNGDQCPFSHDKEEIRQDLLNLNNELSDEENIQKKFIDLSFNTKHSLNNDIQINITQPTSQNNASLNFWNEKRILRESIDENIIGHNNQKLNTNDSNIPSNRSKFILKSAEQVQGDDIFSDIQNHVFNYLFDDDKITSPGRKLLALNFENNTPLSNQDSHNPILPLTKQIKDINIGSHNINKKENQIDINSTSIYKKPNKLFSEVLLSNKKNDPLFDFLNEGGDIKDEQKISQVNNSTKDIPTRGQTIQSQPKSFLEVAQSSINKPLTKTKANISPKNDNTQNKTSSEYFSNQEISTNVENKKRLLCTFYYEGGCRYKDSCKFIHGNLCNICKKNALYPNDFEQNEKHINNCSLKLELESSKTIVCSLCKENVIQKGQKFGLLPECNDIFCVTCIKQYRTDTSNAECPICSSVSHFVVPSRVFPTNPSRKTEIIDLYKVKMKKILCKYFESGECKFGEYCHYSHDISMNEDNMNLKDISQNEIIKRNSL